MDYEQKYKEALEDMRAIYPNLKGDAKLAVEHAFPELAESEDEKIRKAIIEHFKQSETEFPGLTFAGYYYSDVLAFLEKQKVKEKQDRMMPVYNDRDSFESALEKAWKSYNESGSRTVDSCEDDYVECVHAKGFREGYLFGLEKQKEQKPAEWSEEDSDNLERVDNYLWMLDNYVGDDCAMPQGKTDKIRGNIQGVLSPWLKSLPERFNLQPKQGWSEENERMLERAIHIIVEYSDIDEKESEIVQNWLKSLRPSWKPSEEQLKYLLMLADYFESEGGTSNAKTLREFHEQLKKL